MTDIPTFSLCEGGRFHAALRRVRLTGGPQSRVAFVALLLIVGWLPLVLLSAAGGTLLGGVDHPLRSDLGALIRGFVVIPILVFAEPFADWMLGIIVEFFRRSGLIRPADLPAFEAAADRAQRRATSDIAEAILLVFALLLPHVLVASMPHLATGSAWFGTVVEGQLDITPAGQWYAWISLPLVQFLLLTWLWRSVCWWQLLWRVSRLDLSLLPAHPDGAGGLGFLMFSSRAFLPVFVGLSGLAATTIANQVQLGGVALLATRGPIAAFVLVEFLLLLVPHLLFLPALARSRNRDYLGFSLAANAMTREFGRLWTDPQNPRGAELLDSPHPSAMIDYAGTFGLVTVMRPTGISLRSAVALLVPLAAPFAPLLLYRYSLKEILQQVLQLVR